MKKQALMFSGLVCMIVAAGFAAAQSSSTSSTASATNMVVDFTSTSFGNASLRPGDTGILNLVIKNSGGRRAENIQVVLTSTAVIRTDKRFSIGDMDPGDSKTIPVIFAVTSTARTGLTSMQVQVIYNGYRYDGSIDDNKLTTWEIPMNIMGDPLFQMTPVKTTYYQDTLDELSISGLTKDKVKDLEATLSSNCTTVIGSSRRYVGNVQSNQTFNIAYQIKPMSAGACTASLYLSYTDESGGRVSDNVSIGLNVEDAGVDFKVVNISYAPTGPGEETNVVILLKNVGHADADDVTLYLNLTTPFAPVDTSEKYVAQVRAGQEVKADFRVAVSWDSETKAYTIPMLVSYKVGGTSYSVGKDIGLDVTGRVILEVINVGSSSGNVRVDVANIGTRTADGVKATLIIASTASDQQTTLNRSRRTGGNASQASGPQRLVAYKSDIKPSKQSTFTFQTSATGPATLELEYTSLNNERVTQTERITMTGGSSSSLRSTSSSSTSTTTYALAAAVLATAYWVYRKRRNGKKK